jgi:hypothetical protein
MIVLAAVLGLVSESSLVDPDVSVVAQVSLDDVVQFDARRWPLRQNRRHRCQGGHGSNEGNQGNQGRSGEPHSAAATSGNLFARGRREV